MSEHAQSGERVPTMAARPGQAPGATAAHRSAPAAYDRLLQVAFPGAPLVTGSFDTAAAWLAAELLARPRGNPLVVVHVNTANYYRLLRDDELRSDLERLSTMLLDGIGMKLGGLILGRGRLPDLNGTDLVPMVLERLEDSRTPIYCLGSTATVIERAVREIRRRFPRVPVVGSHAGYFDEAAEPGIIDDINASGARLLLVGRGFVTQERFVLRHLRRLRVSVAWNVGGLFDFVSAAKPRAPRWMRRIRLEWLFRLGLEPKRMFHRNFVATPAALAFLVKTRLMNEPRPLVSAPTSKGREKDGGS